MVFEPDFSLDRSMMVSSIAALSVCRAFEEVIGLGPKIKWVNDIYLNGKKVCGILTEAETNFETGSISRIIAVSYTHLDVYKRQIKNCVCPGSP